MQVQPPTEDVQSATGQKVAHSRILWLEPDAWVAFFTLVLGASTILLWRETRRLAKGAEDQNRTLQQSVAQAGRAADAATEAAEQAIEGNRLSREAIIAEHRPWLKIESGTIIEDIEFSAYGRFVFEIKIKNVGRSPAVGINFVPKVEVSPIPTPEALYEIRNGDFPQENILEVVIFPGSEYVYQRSEIIPRFRLMAIEEKNSNKILDLSLFGVVDYRSQIDGTIYKTGFAYFVNSDKDGRNFKPEAPIIIFRKDLLYLQPWLHGWFAT